MSTDFTCDQDPTQSVRFVRWGSRRVSEETGQPAFEFGTMSNWEECWRMADAGMTFSPVGMRMDSDPDWTRQGFEDVVVQGRATFGEGFVTVEVGSGEMWRFTQEDTRP